MFDLDGLVDRLLSCVMEHGRPINRVLPQEELMLLCARAKHVFLSQSSLVEVEPPISVCGDIHGQYTDLLRIFNRCGFPPQTAYIFLGDYVDRGKFSLETVSLLLAYKVKFPENFFLLRGNHECAPINRIYGFYEECQRKYSVRLWQVFQDTFNCMPFSGLVGDKIICMHGGLSPEMTSLDQIRELSRPMDPATPSLALDLLWSDPQQDIRGWQSNSRGVSFVFGEDVVADFCDRLQLDLVARAHQVVQDGYEFFANRKLVTIFSASHYCGEFDNAAGVMSVDEDLKCSFHIFKSTDKSVAVVPRNNKRC